MPALYAESAAKLTAETLHGALDRALEAYQRLDDEAVALHRENRRLRMQRNVAWMLTAVAAALIAGRWL